MTDTHIPTRTLNDGTKIPLIGLGTYRLNGPTGVQAMLHGIDIGYRLLDSAFTYENEGAIGEVVRRSPIPREQLVLTSKLPGRHQQYDEAVTTVHESLYRAGLDYWDLYLIHWPNPARGTYVEAFQALIDMKEAGLIRSVGVCNFLPEHLHTLKEHVGVLPSVNQVELHPRFNQSALRALHDELGICTQSWSPLGRKLALVHAPVICALAEETGLTPAQLILRWHYQHGAVPLPKSANPERQKENANIFHCELSQSQMERIDALSLPDGRMAGQDPAFYEEF
ncbi:MULTISPECIES: aldo/keto reductase [unclassified Schaalia]|uniref:aldo/keto reductase n=1 Tax=unclassified Schaalia TaxID=2691889 RepID=UPI001E5AF746|nr:MULTISPECIES: aldo/keto reductase [unclassified Schaalia]MCD4549995.1 aldo/keto reductase [Schaalia sp. lx-260]MCD4557644.1 aldo/keto reductase [Schaalia sp. lx-100]